MKAFFKRMEDIPSQEMKVLDPQMAFEIIRRSQKLFGNFFGSKSIEMTESGEFSLILQMIQCPNLATKLRGMKELGELIEAIEPSTEKTDYYK